MSLCKNCGQENLEETAFCTNCGTSLQEEPVVEVFEGEVVGQKPKKPVLPTIALILGIVSPALWVLGLLCSWVLPVVLLPINLVLNLIPIVGPLIKSLLDPSKLALFCHIIGILIGIAAIVISIIAAKKMKAIGQKTACPTVGLILGIVGIVLNASSTVIIAIVSFLSAILSILSMLLPQLTSILAGLLSGIPIA